MADLNELIDAPFPPAAEPSLRDKDAQRPLRSRRVRLVGKMKEVGFQEQQWLLEYEGRYIQVTELLYRIVEQSNGTHTLAEIAEKVSDSTEWLLDEGDVKHLIDGRLVPLGLIGADAHNLKPQASPLGINVKFRTLTPRFIEPITAVLHFLCSWVIVTLIITAAVITHWWLYAIHHIGGAFQAAAYTPGGVFFAIALVVFAAVFHEFGHASALRYHGGRVGNMGVALYLVYPVFYTDVTDDYRLSRWARISTDLGGIYFHLIFTSGLFAAYFVTHRELLLFCVFLIDLEILEQFMPLVRLDGYWLLCDLTGIPDFFALMTPFVTSSLSSRAGAILESATDARGPQPRKLPEFKGWVKAAFVSYIAIAMPALAYAFGRMIISLPELITTAWGGLQAQVEILKATDVSHHFILVSLVVLQIIVLTLPVPATIYLLWITLKSPLNRLLDWASSRRRNAFATVVAIVTCYGIAAVLVRVPGIRSFRHIDGASGQAEQLIRQAQAATAKLHSIEADLEGSIGEDRYTGRMVLQRPNLARIEISGTKGLGKILLVSDGKTATTYFPDDNQFAQVKAGAHGEFVQSTLVEQVEQFFQTDLMEAGMRFQYVGHRTEDGIDYDIVKPATPSGENTEYFISREDRLIHRSIKSVAAGKEPRTWIALKNIRTDISVDKSLFSWTLPRTAKPVQLPAGAQLP